MTDGAVSTSRLWIVLLLVAGVLLALFISAALWVQNAVYSDFKGYSGPERFVMIERGTSVAEMGDQLAREGVIASALLFQSYVRLTRSSSDLRAGEYRFSEPLSLAQVVGKLQSGDIYYYKLTVPEGLDMEETAQIFIDAGFGSAESFRTAMQDPSPISSIDPEARSLEGYLFPETYYLIRGMTADQIVTSMVENFKEVWGQERQSRAREMEMSVRQVITLASLVEKETALSGERPLVSAVFHNRLDLGMKLACDPTVIYAVKQVKEYDGVIHQSDLDLDSPYNTYLYPGLPPGPIANPGELSIQAALYPADSQYLYFVSRNDGSHIFSTDYRSHSRAVQQYQRGNN